MSLVKNEDVINYFNEKADKVVVIRKVKVECTCITQAAIKVCRVNCDSTENNKINYDG